MSKLIVSILRDMMPVLPRWFLLIPLVSTCVLPTPEGHSWFHFRQIFMSILYVSCDFINNPVVELIWRTKCNPLQYSCLENSTEPGRLQSIGSQRARPDWAYIQWSLPPCNAILGLLICLLQWSVCPSEQGLHLIHFYSPSTYLGHTTSIWWMTDTILTRNGS